MIHSRGLVDWSKQHEVEGTAVSAVAEVEKLWVRQTRSRQSLNDWTATNEQFIACESYTDQLGTTHDPEATPTRSELAPLRPAVSLLGYKFALGQLKMTEHFCDFVFLKPT